MPRIRTGEKWVAKTWEEIIIDQIKARKAIPVFSNSISNDLILGNHRQLILDFAEYANYPLADKDNLAHLTQFMSIMEAGAKGAMSSVVVKKGYLNFVKNQLYDLAETGGVAEDLLNEVVTEFDNMDFSELARRLGYPRFADAPQDPLLILAGLDLPIYLTTGYHQMMEAALHRAGKRPRTGICRWNKHLEKDIPDIFAGGYEPSEEIFTTHLERWQDRAGFFQQLEEVMAADLLLWVVLSLREDYAAALDPYAPLLANRMRARFYMQRMGYETALEAVRRPTERYGRPFAPGVAEQLVDNLRQIRVREETKTKPGQFVEPVQLQLVCYQLWEKLKDREPGPITAEDVQQLGDVDTALADFYGEAIAQVVQAGGVSEIALREWFNQKLITEARTRGTVYMGETQTAELPNKVVRSLADQYLLRAEMRAGGVWYELVHDRFVEPILQANEHWLQRQDRLVQDALAWRRSDEDDSKLF